MRKTNNRVMWMRDLVTAPQKQQRWFESSHHLSKYSEKMSVKQYKNPYTYQYVAPYGYHFVRSGINYGRVAWFSNVDGVTIEKDEDK